MTAPGDDDDERHPETGERMSRGVRRQSFTTQDGGSYSYDLPGWWTPSGAGMHAGGDMVAAFEAGARIDAERKAAGLPTLRELRRARAAARTRTGT